MVEKPVLNNKGRVTGQRAMRPVWNNAQRVNHQNKLTHPHPKRNFVPTSVATKSGQVPVNAAKQSSPKAAASISTARPVNTAPPKPKVKDVLPTTYSYFKAHSPVRRDFNQKSAAKTNNFSEKVNTAKARYALGLRYKVGESSSSPTARPPEGFRADYGFVATMDREIMRDLERDVGYEITDTWDEMLVDMPGEPPTDETELGQRMTNFVTTVRQDTDEIYVRLDDEQTERQMMAGRLNMLYRHRRAHAHTGLLIEREARMSREAWGRSMSASDLAHSEVMSLRTTVLGQQAVITELQTVDCKTQATITELLAANRRRQA
ncbi:hypothetical protein Tco_1028300 [Tanacetum coccineum]|uniref:Uncharacterized protein n=1 Tax=Tanacetum coccineum TaxID=301880 RepID=A0ABQ5G0L0_9ASTR